MLRVTKCEWHWLLHWSLVRSWPFTCWLAEVDGFQWAGLLVGLLAAVAVFFTSESGRQLIAFGRDAVREVKKVVWPERKEAMQITAYVFAFVVVMALFLWLTDKTLEWVFYDLILGWKK